ncbi:tetratricopeptide repeat protein, partial [Rhodospirillaceae bacterium]|nr:tetratricopeptide repeat protein [Rhodospirillaceae bacterium]
MNILSDMSTCIEQLLKEGVAEHKAGSFFKARKLYRQVLSYQPNNPDANHNFGILLVLEGEVNQSVQYFKSAVEANPSIAQYWFSFIDALVNLKKNQEAWEVLFQGKKLGLKGSTLDQLETIIINNDKNTPPEKHIIPLIKLIQSRRYNQAANRGEYLTLHFPKNEIIANMTGVAYARLEQHQLAIQHYHNAIKLKASFPDPYNNLGITFHELKRNKDAILSYKKAIQLRVNNTEVYTNLGITLCADDSIDKAVKSFNRALKANPTYSKAYYNMAISQKQLRKLEASILNYKKAIILEPGFVEAYTNLGNNQ